MGIRTGRQDDLLRSFDIEGLVVVLERNAGRALQSVLSSCEVNLWKSVSGGTARTCRVTLP